MSVEDIDKFLDVILKAAVFHASFGVKFDAIHQIDSFRLLGDTVEFLDSSCGTPAVPSIPALSDFTTVVVKEDAVSVSDPETRILLYSHPNS